MPTIASPRDWGMTDFLVGVIFFFLAAIVFVVDVQYCSCKSVWRSSWLLYALLSAGLDSCTGFLMEVSLTPSAKSGP